MVPVATVEQAQILGDSSQTISHPSIEFWSRRRPQVRSPVASWLSGAGNAQARSQVAAGSAEAH